MSIFSNLPVTKQDQQAFEDLAKFCCARMRKAAYVDRDFAPFHRHPVDFVAKGLGSTSSGKLYAHAPDFLHGAGDGLLTRDDVASLLLKALTQGMERLSPDEREKLSNEQLVAIAHALPAIVQAASEKLKMLQVDRLTFERTILDPLLAKHVPPYEFAVLNDRSKVFIREEARRKLRALGASAGFEALQRISTEEILSVVRSSIYPVVDAVTQMSLPASHKTVVLADESGAVVGVSFQHPTHGGVVPVCCASVAQYALMYASLHLPGQVQRHRLQSDLGREDPTSIIPFRTSFTKPMEVDGPPVFYSQIEPGKAIEYLEALEAALKGTRVKCAEDVMRPLRGATLRWQDISTPGSGKTRRRWGLVSAPGEELPSFVMSSIGTIKGDFASAEQWYLRQTVWLDEAAVPELGVPLAYPVYPQPYDNEETKVIPASAKTFYQRARAHVERMLPARRVSAPVVDALRKIKKQDDLIREIEDAMKIDTDNRTQAGRAAFTHPGFVGGIGRIPIGV